MPFGLGYDLAVIERIIEERKSAEARAERAVPLAEHRRPTKDETASKCAIRIFTGSDNPDYLTARIARDRPDILERMKAGEYRSVRAASPDRRAKGADRRVYRAGHRRAGATADGCNAEARGRHPAMFN